MKNKDFEKIDILEKEASLFFKQLNTIEDETLLTFKKVIKENLVMSGQEISNEVASFLSFLLNLKKPNKVFEFGTFAGYSTLIMARQLDKNGSIVTADVNEQPVEIGRKFWREEGLEGKINFIKGKGGEIIDSIDEKFDFIFIDADKKGTREYFDKSLDKLNIDGLIMIDNIWLNGGVIKPSRDIHKSGIDFINYIKDKEGINKVFLSIGDGLLLVSKSKLIELSDGKIIKDS